MCSRPSSRAPAPCSPRWQWRMSSPNNSCPISGAVQPWSLCPSTVCQPLWGLLCQTQLLGGHAHRFISNCSRCPGLRSFGQIPISLGDPLTKIKSRNTALHCWVPGMCNTLFSVVQLSTSTTHGPNILPHAAKSPSQTHSLSGAPLVHA